jgi:hypothetical protein
MIRITIDTNPPDPDQPMPTWQPDLFLRMCAKSLAEQKPLFPGFTESPVWKPAKPQNTDQTTPLFEPS